MKGFYHVSKNKFRIGDVLVSGKKIDRPHLSFFCAPNDISSELLNNPDYMARRKVEEIFEECRLALKVDISRKQAIFANLDIESALKWRRSGKSRCNGNIYELIPDSSYNDKLKTQRADLCWYNYAVRVAKNCIEKKSFVFLKNNCKTEIFTTAEKYWQSEMFFSYVPFPEYKNPCWEVLLEGTFVIKSMIPYPFH